jgi:hypothetical protein
MTNTPGRRYRITGRRWRSRPHKGSINRLVFTRDAPLGIVPIGVRSHKRPEFAIRTEGGPAEKEALVSFLGRGSTHRGLTESVCDFVEEVARLLVEYGEASYELVAELSEDIPHDDEANEEPFPNCHLELVLPQTPLAAESIVGPVVPRGGRDVSRRLRHLPADRVFRIKLPRSLGRPRSHRRMLRRLDKIEHASGRFVVSATSMASIPQGYDHEAAQRASESEIVRLTRQWGVLAFLQPKNMTDYFTVAGTIYNRRSQTILRDHIISRLNELLKDVALPEVRIEGLPTVSDIDRALEDLRTGRVDLKQAAESTDW